MLSMYLYKPAFIQGRYLYAHKAFLARADIRQPSDDPLPPEYFPEFLNLASTQEALGVNINYTSISSDFVGQGFLNTGEKHGPILILSS